MNRTTGLLAGLFVVAAVLALMLSGGHAATGEGLAVNPRQPCWWDQHCRDRPRSWRIPGHRTNITPTDITASTASRQGHRNRQRNCDQPEGEHPNNSTGSTYDGSARDHNGGTGRARGGTGDGSAGRTRSRACCA